MQPITLIKKNLMFEKEKASLLICGSATYAEGSRPSCLFYN